MVYLASKAAIAIDTQHVVILVLSYGISILQTKCSVHNWKSNAGVKFKTLAIIELIVKVTMRICAAPFPRGGVIMHAL
jgi:hypothetical protein